MVLKEQLAKQTGLSLLNTAMVTLFGVASFFFLTKVLPREEIAIMGIAAGFLAMLTPILITPDIALFRNYGDIRKRFNQFVSAFLLFWVARTVAVMLIIIVGAFLLFSSKGNLFILYVIGSGIVMNLNMLRASIQEIFYVEMKQRDILNLNFAYHIIFLILLYAVYVRPSLAVYLLVWLGVSVLFSAAWIFRLFRAFHFKPEFNLSQAKTIVSDILSKVAVWTHLISSVTQAIYRGDIFFLGFFATAFVAGNFTIALMLSSLFVFVPQILQKMCLTGLTRTTNPKMDLKMTNVFVKYNILISLIQVTGYWLFGRFVLSLIDAQNYNDIFELGWYIVLGSSLFNVIRPLHSLCIARADLKKYFWSVYFPAGLVAVIAYGLAAFWFGGLATAQANILVYGVLSLLIFVFSVRHMKYALPSEWVTSEERELLRKIKRKFVSA